MNVLFKMIPKEKVVYIYDDFTIRQAMEKMEHYRYSVIPILNKEGLYVGSISEGDILWYIKSQKEFNYKIAENSLITEITPNKKYQSIGINHEMKDLITMIENQNFVPVVDDRSVFIGMVTRKSVIQYLT
ncbi:MAG: CBS domain-containing protein [Candidatus Phytoplasma sp.]|nr:CBS domain-containing protein [Phytoplasma sp.]